MWNNLNSGAEDAFNSDAFQRSWEIHMQTFRPILENAFLEDYVSRIKLTNALNKINAKDIKGGLTLLQSIEDACVTNDDKAAWIYFTGLCCELIGDKEKMITFYQQAAEFGHRFYLPYLKVAKYAYADAMYDVAAWNYAYAIECLLEYKPPVQGELLLASAYTNYASCLITMHRYAEAQENLKKSYDVLPQQPGREATEAILHAVRGEHHQALQKLDNLKKSEPHMYDATKVIVDDIINGVSSHFYEVYISNLEIASFWQWFAQQEEFIKDHIIRQDYDVVFAMLQERLAEVFPFMNRALEMSIAQSEKGFELTFADMYAVGLRCGYEKLIQACPDNVRKSWTFVIEH